MFPQAERCRRQEALPLRAAEDPRDRGHHRGFLRGCDCLLRHQDQWGLQIQDQNVFYALQKAEHLCAAEGKSFIMNINVNVNVITL